MLILNRKLGERILIGDSIEVVVVEIERGKVRLGIIAPRNVEVMRPEYREELARKKAASDGKAT